MKTTKSGTTAKRAKRISVDQRISTAAKIVQAGNALKAARATRQALGQAYEIGCAEYNAQLEFEKANRAHK
jgi:hypothetical protein